MNNSSGDPVRIIADAIREIRMLAYETRGLALPIAETVKRIEDKLDAMDSGLKKLQKNISETSNRLEALEKRLP